MTVDGVVVRADAVAARTTQALKECQELFRDPLGVPANVGLVHELACLVRDLAHAMEETTERDVIGPQRRTT